MWEAIIWVMQIAGGLMTAVAGLSLAVKVTKTTKFLKPLAAPVMKGLVMIEIARAKGAVSIATVLLHVGRDRVLEIMKARGLKQKVYRAMLTSVVLPVVIVMSIPLILRVDHRIMLVTVGEATKARVMTAAVREARKCIRLNNLRAFYAKPWLE